MSKLKPCPFCGGKGIPKMFYPTPFGKTLLTVMCENCGGMMVDTDLEHCLNDAIKAWNKRNDTMMEVEHD